MSLCKATRAAADIKLICFMVLLIFGVNPDAGKPTEKDTVNKPGEIFLYNSTDLKNEDNLTSLLCTWNGSQCYVQCYVASVNFTTNINCVESAMKLKQTDKIRGQNKTQLVFNTGKKNTICNVTKWNLTTLIKAQNMCNASFILDAYLRAEKDYIDQMINSSLEKPNQTYELEIFKMTVFRINMSSTVDASVKLSAPKLFDDDPPIDVFFPVKLFRNDLLSNNMSSVAILRYRSAKMFTNKFQTLLSEVIRVETVGDVHKTLSKRLVIIFPVNSSNPIPANYMLLCQFYNKRDRRWHDRSSFTNLENFNSSNTVNCSYDHMTLFTVIRVKVREETPCVSYMVNRTENIFLYNSTELKIQENLTSLLCTWEGLQCYVACTPVNLTTNLTCVGSAITLKQNDQIEGQNKTRLVFNIGEQDIECNVTKCVLDEIRPLLIRLSNMNDLKDLKQIIWLKKACNTLFDIPSIRKQYISIEKKFIQALITAPFDGSTKNYSLKDFSMCVVKMDMMKPTEPGLVQIPAPKVHSYNLPLDIFVPIKPFQSVSEEQRKVAVVTYSSARQFTNNMYPVIEGKVIRVETAGRELKDLSDPLVIKFMVNNSKLTSGNYTMSCQFYDDKEHKWDDKGSFTNLEYFNASNIVSCSYDHMTPFAVLLVDVTQINPQQWKILSVISYIGCSVSLLFSAVTIFLYVFMKKSSRDTSISIHVSLSTALFLLNISFLFIEWGATWSQESVCVLIAVIIQYSLLSCFSWMAIEALHLYLLLIKVFNTYIKHYMVKLSLLGWGVPAVVVGGSLCVYQSQPFYGIISLNTNAVTKYCWITDTRFLYGMNITYFSLTFLFNTYILVRVTNQIHKLRRLNIKGSKRPSRKDFCTVLSLTVLLGMTWGLAFFTSGYTNYTVLYLFCICNSLQGFFLFLWFYGTMKRNRSLMKTSQTCVSKLPSDSDKNKETTFCYRLDASETEQKLDNSVHIHES